MARPSSVASQPPQLGSIAATWRLDTLATGCKEKLFDSIGAVFPAVPEVLWVHDRPGAVSGSLYVRRRAPLVDREVAVGETDSSGARVCRIGKVSSAIRNRMQ